MIIADSTILLQCKRTSAVDDHYLPFLPTSPYLLPQVRLSSALDKRTWPPKATSKFSILISVRDAPDSDFVTCLLRDWLVVGPASDKLGTMETLTVAHVCKLTVSHLFVAEVTSSVSLRAFFSSFDLSLASTLSSLR